ncbi:uncharacterized protein LOC102806752 [Saccoglossus kowalevskii]|uniref:N-acetyltransferase ESCO2-like n=1 Tax=Saccoglossus kowalevskii TaxID=10224 RepID=A0ABM0MEB7_SACKO|nr:PREDICTED: N-acetyltransferase ESCO2-like [Saccoglossus kowalevskii]
MIGSGRIITSPLKQRKSESANDSRMKRQTDWLDDIESPNTRKSPRRSFGGSSPRAFNSSSNRQGSSIVRCLEHDLEENLSPILPSKSFYSGNKSKYISPIERKQLRELDEQRRKSLGEDITVNKPVKKIQIKTPKSNNRVKGKTSKSSSGKKKNVKTVVRSDVKKPRLPELKSIRSSPRKSPRKVAKSENSPRKEQLNGVKTPVRRSPRKSPRKQENGFSFTASKKPSSASKGIRLYMQGLNKGKKKSAPVYKERSLSSSAVKPSKKKSMTSQGSPSLTPARLEKNGGKSKADLDDVFLDDFGFSTLNGTLSEKLCTSSSVGDSPKKRKREISPKKTPRKSPKKAKLDNVALTQDTPDSDTEETVAPVRKSSKELKMFPIFTPPSTPSPTAKRHQRMKAKSSSSPSSGTFSSILKKSRDKDGKEQMILDLGQKRFGATMCSTCGMVYSLAEPEDESDHIRFHKKFVECVKFPGWKKENVMQEFHDGRIIMVTEDDHRYAQRKVEDVRELVDTELGFLEGSLACKENGKAFLFISSEKKVVGCCIIEKITKAYRVLTDTDQVSPDSDEDKKRAWCCSNDAVPAICGVSRIWVWGKMRRKKIATRLIDCVKCHFMYGCSLTNDDIAFSDPTPDGKMFATKYTSTPKFLVYNFTSH